MNNKNKQRKCEVCGKEWITNHPSHKERFCCRECYRIYCKTSLEVKKHMLKYRQNAKTWEEQYGSLEAAQKHREEHISIHKGAKRNAITRQKMSNWQKNKSWETKFGKEKTLELKKALRKRLLGKSLSKETVNKIINTKLKNGTFGKSKEEDFIYSFLLTKFKDVKRNYKSKEYPFRCDFYIVDLNLYIEYQGFWTHGDEPFNKNNKEHLKIIEIWKTKNTIQYNKAIKDWTVRDPLKRQTARENNLNWIEFFKLTDCINWINKQIEEFGLKKKINEVE